MRQENTMNKPNINSVIAFGILALSLITGCGQKPVTQAGPEAVDTQTVAMPRTSSAWLS
jgi:hypothetical protein